MNKFIIIVLILFFMKQEYISFEDIINKLTNVVEDTRSESVMIDHTIQTIEDGYEDIPTLKYEEIEPMNLWEDWKKKSGKEPDLD